MKAGRWTGDFAVPWSWATCQHPMMLCEISCSHSVGCPQESTVQCDILVVFCCHFSPISHFLLYPSFCFILLPECTCGVPCHGNTCRWRQSSSSTSSASAEEVTNHSTSREVLSPRYPWTICKRGCPWSTRFSQVFSLLLRTSGKALFPPRLHLIMYLACATSHRAVNSQLNGAKKTSLFCIDSCVTGINNKKCASGLPEPKICTNATRGSSATVTLDQRVTKSYV